MVAAAGGWVDFEIELGVISIAVEGDSVLADDVSEGEHIDGEQGGAEYGSLGDTAGDIGY